MLPSKIASFGVVSVYLCATSDNHLTLHQPFEGVFTMRPSELYHLVRRLNMSTVHIKKLLRIGGSLAIILPSQWTKGRVKAGEEMVVVGNSELRIFPVHPQESRPMYHGDEESTKDD